MIELDHNAGWAVCKECPLNESSKFFSVVPDSGKVDILCVSQSPTRDDESYGGLFTGFVGNILHPVLSQYSENLAYCYTVLCRCKDKDNPKVDRQPVTLELKACSLRFNADITEIIETYSPKVVLVFGAVARKRFSKIDISSLKVAAPVAIKYIENPNILHKQTHLKDNYITNLHNNLKSVFGANESDAVVKTFVTYDELFRDQFLEECYKSRNLGVDIETNGKNPFLKPDFYIGCTAVTTDWHTFWFDTRKQEGQTVAEYKRNILKFDVLKQVLEDENIEKIYANVLFDVLCKFLFGINTVNYKDLLPLAFMYDNTHHDYDLEAIVLRTFPELSAYKSLFRVILNDSNGYLDTPERDLQIYNSFDAYLTKMTYNFMFDKLDKASKKVFVDIHSKMLEVLIDIKVTGMKIDKQLFNTYTHEFKGLLVEFDKHFKEAHDIDNINSPKQIAHWMFDVLKLKSVKKTDSGAASTDKDVIEIYKDVSPDMKKLYEARRISALLTNLLPKITNALDINDLVHPNYKHFNILSGRLACGDPPLQGIPRDKTGIKSLDARSLRRAFIPRRPNSYIVELDFSNQEVRLVAWFSQDKGLIGAFNRGEDVHRFVASMIFNKEIKFVDDLERQIGKACAFGSIFGETEEALSIKLNQPKEKCKGYLEKFYKIFPGIKQYSDRCAAIVDTYLEITSVIGRKRKFLINYHQRGSVNEAHRQAMNHTIQSVAADIMYISLIRVHRYLKEKKLLHNGIDILHTVHDSILFEIDYEHLFHEIPTIQKIMEQIPNDLGLNIKFPVDMKVGKFWGDKQKLESILGIVMEEPEIANV